MHTITDGLMLNAGSYVKLHRIDQSDTILIARSQSDGSLVNAATGDPITEQTLKNWRVGESFSVINSLRPFSGNKLSASEVLHPKLESLNELSEDEDGSYVGRMSLTILTPDGVELPCAFNIIVDISADGSFSVKADDDAEVSLGNGFVVGYELDAVVAYELNEVFCLDQTLRQFDSFFDSIEQRVNGTSA